jgi:PAS domain S-box-containing protein
MASAHTYGNENRVLLLAPTAKDAAAAEGLFASIGISFLICKNLGEICREIDEGAGVAIVPDEMILNDREGCLARALANQAPWSDLPLIVLTPPHGLIPRASAALESVGHMTLVPRPVEIRSLVSTIRTALRDRARQYATRDHLLDRERHATDLRASQERLAFALSAGSLGSWELDLVSGAFQCSPICKTTFGLADDATLSRQALFDAIHPLDRERVDREINQSQSDYSDYHSEYRNVWPDGSTHWVMVRGRGIYDATGTPVRMAGVSLDITDRKQAEAEREFLLAEARRAKEEADTANRMKDEFLATLSHELRTPLNAILGWARILRRGNVDPKDLEEGVSAIERNSTAQAQIIEDLLDVSRIIAGKFRLEVQTVNVHEVIESAIAAVLPAAHARGIRVQKVLDSLAGPVSGDPARLQQIVWNLLSNAVKFTLHGGKVSVLLERVNSHVEVSVIDTGMGIKPEFLPHAFDRFRQADSSTTRRHGGLGLGLAIVKQLVEMHGGTVRAKSPGEGQGATFTIALPITVVHPQQSEQTPPKQDDSADLHCKEGHLQGVRVLVVDDEIDARRLIERVLAECGAEVALASSAAEALEVLDEFEPHVLVSDVGMPEQDGYDLLRSVRSRGKSSAQIPAAALTAFARSEDRRRAMLAGFQTHVAKPVDPAELLAVVASLAGRTGTE